MRKVVMLCALLLIMVTTLFGCATTGSEQTGTSTPTSTGSQGGGRGGHH